MKNTYSLKTVGSSTLNSLNNRVELDFYQTPEYAVDTLVDNYDFKSKNIWEPFAGDGAISKILLYKGFNVFSSDIVERNFKLDKVTDYCNLKDELPYDDFSIVTNPPYKKANEVLRYILTEIKPITCCMFLPLRYLEGNKRHNEVFSKFKPNNVFVYVKRLGCFTYDDLKNGNVTKYGVGSAVAYMWLCFDRDSWLSQDTKTELKWIN